MSQPTTLLCHLHDCVLHPDDVHFHTQCEHHESYLPQKGTHQQMIVHPYGAGPAVMPEMIPSAPVGLIPMPLQSELLQSNITLVAPTATMSTSPLFPTSSLSLPSTIAQISSSNLLRLAYNSIPPSPALSSISVTLHHSKCQWLTQNSIYHSGSGSVGSSASTSSSPIFHWSPGPNVTWSSADQMDWETGLVRLTASAGLPLWWIENPEWKKLCDWFLPMVKNPSSKVLTTQIILGTLNSLQSSAQTDCQGSVVTLQCDGWTGENHHHLLAFMMTCNRKVSLRMSS